jgi:hypothetical protein
MSHVVLQIVWNAYVMWQFPRLMMRRVDWTRDSSLRVRLPTNKALPMSSTLEQDVHSQGLRPTFQVFHPSGVDKLVPASIGWESKVLSTAGVTVGLLSRLPEVPFMTELPSLTSLAACYRYSLWSVVCIYGLENNITLPYSLRCSSLLPMLVNEISGLL